MRIPKQLSLYFAAICSGFSLFLFSGCVTISSNTYKNMVAYEPVRSPVQIDASAAIEAVDTLTPEMRAIWKKWMNNDANIANYLSAFGQTLQNDLATSGLFARVVPNTTDKADYSVKALSEESRAADFRLRITLTATENATSTQVSSHTREVSLGSSMFDANAKLKEQLPGLMAALKADLAADLLEKARRVQEKTDRAEAELLNNKPLADLIADSDRSVALARGRNRAIIAAKNQQLPAILREKNTEELTELVVKIEQTILDLNHECEVAKDQAQQATATNGDARQTDELRGLAICYRERIELLKPILTALKDEIANRSR
jgi:hypothetical protein